MCITASASPRGQKKFCTRLFCSQQSHSDLTAYICRICFFNRVPFLNFFSVRAANAIAIPMVLSQLDHCNSCLCGVPSQRLQLVQNTATRIVTHTQKREHYPWPVLKELHWLLARKRINHKIMSLAYKCYKGMAPEYLQELVLQYIPAQSLYLSSQPHLWIPSATEKHTQKLLGFRAFSDSAPKLWNALPQTVRKADSCLMFHRCLKTQPIF